MNGGVNGMMEESKEVSNNDSQEDSKEVKIDTSEEADPDNSQCETVDSDRTYHVDSGNEPADNSIAGITENTNSLCSVENELDEYSTETASLPTLQENSSTKSLTNHCSNSNESFVDTLDSQSKSEIMPEQENCLTTQQNFSNDFKNDCSRVFDENISKMVSNNGVSDEADSEADSDDEEFSEASGEQRAEETVSINSESEVDAQDESSQESQNKNKNKHLLILEHDITGSQNGNADDCSSPEVHEIVSDNEDCVVEEKQKPTEIQVQLRRSSRAIKRKRYDDDIENGDYESDIEEIAMGDALRRRSKAIVINDTKTLVEMAAKQIKSGIQKKEPTVVIIDTNSMSSVKGNTIRKNYIPPSNSALSAQNLYQSIVARGTTVTPISNKNSMASQSSCNTQTSILPSLTDDMYVVEAPSFIVPYVYEKPSVKPFRKFVDNLGNELKEQRAKEEEEEREREKEEQEKNEQDKSEQEKNENKEKEDEEEASDAETEISTKTKEDLEEENKQKKREEKRERRRRRNDDDDASWDGQSSTDSDDEIGSDEEDKTVVIKDKADVIDDIKGVTDLTVDKVVTGKSDNYFDLSLGKFFMNIGLNLVQEYVQNDLLKQQNRKLYREKKGGHSTKITESSIASLKKNLEFSKENNAPYVFKQHKCEFCSFKTESSLVMAHHLETPHMKNSVYKCNFCVYESRSPHDILYHMEAEHSTRGKLERAPAYHQCANCPFEDNGKGKLARHLIPCGKKFKPELNLAPPIEWEPPAKIPKIARARNAMMGSYHNTFHRGQVGNNIGRPPMSGVMASTSFRPRGRSPMGIAPRSTPVQGIPILRSGVMVRHNTPSPVLVSPNYASNNGKNASIPKSLHQPSISITPLPRQPVPTQPPPPQQNKSSCVICEICDGYIKDLEQLRNHMQWIHKVKIHPKMIYNRPPLNCQKCQFRFFTDQGLERHLLGSHGLVTSSMQEAANKGKDAGRCPVCGRVYQWKLLNHVARDHNLTLKPAHLSYKCTVCTATFGMYKQFENHVYSAHSVVAKRVMDKGKTAAPVKAGQSLLKPLKINDEITIIPQPVKSTTPPIKEK
ncbi:FK506-binding protein 5-like isoform X2 [Vanessa tameamea]|uniref:FK506-binding protein 5-like isoform X2 n=1 Tax=Vanessa tameamea TaxID=334116 RepID=A0ABM4AZ08_VANTA